MVWLWDRSGPGGWSASWAAHGDEVHGLAFDPGGRWLWTASDDGTVKRWDLDALGANGPAPAPAASARLPAGARDLALGPETLWVSLRSDSVLRLEPMSLASRGPGARLGYRLQVSPDGAVIAAAAGDHLDLANAAGDGSPFRTLFDGTDEAETTPEVGSVDFGRGGTILAGSYNDRHLRIWDVASGRLLARFPAGGDAISCVAFSPDGRRLAITDELRVRFYEIRDDDVMPVAAAGPNRVEDVAWLPGDRRLAWVAVRTDRSQAEAVVWDGVARRITAGPGRLARAASIARGWRPIPWARSSHSTPGGKPISGTPRPRLPQPPWRPDSMGPSTSRPMARGSGASPLTTAFTPGRWPTAPARRVGRRSPRRSRACRGSTAWRSAASGSLPPATMGRSRCSTPGAVPRLAPGTMLPQSRSRAGKRPSIRSEAWTSAAMGPSPRPARNRAGPGSARPLGRGRLVPRRTRRFGRGGGLPPLGKPARHGLPGWDGAVLEARGGRGRFALGMEFTLPLPGREVHRLRFNPDGECLAILIKNERAVGSGPRSIWPPLGRAGDWRLTDAHLHGAAGDDRLTPGVERDLDRHLGRRAEFGGRGPTSARGRGSWSVGSKRFPGNV